MRARAAALALTVPVILSFQPHHQYHRSSRHLSYNCPQRVAAAALSASSGGAETASDFSYADADAIRWVMGEGSAKNLRGESMTDVIFNGASNRKPVGQATIELLFDNSAGRLTGEYAAYSEISIKRQVSRDGQSSYFLNSVKCRRKDITDIFLGTGLGPRSYSIIEQG